MCQTLLQFDGASLVREHWWGSKSALWKMLVPDGVTLALEKLQRKPSGCPGKLSVFPFVILISYSHSFSKLASSEIFFFSFLCSFIHNKFSHDCPSPHSIECKVIWPVMAPTPHTPPQRTLSPCPFLFPVGQLPYVLFLRYQNGKLPLLFVTWLSSRVLLRHCTCDGSDLFPSFKL